jgi:LacI family transcriptional regulator
MRTKRVAIAIELHWPVRHHQAVAGGILQAARERGWTCAFEPFLGAKGAASARYDGVIGRIGLELAAWARRTRTPTVNVWLNSPDRTLPRVHADHQAAGRQAARHLLERGLRRFGFLGGRGDAAAEKLLEGFRAEVGPVDGLLVPGEPRDAATWRRLQGPLRGWISGWVRPLGILASSDLLARLLVDGCQQAGLRIPDDAAIVGTGNTALLGDLLEPTLSSLELGFERVGRRAAELLADLMARKRPPKEPLLVPPSGVVSRRSSDVFAVEDPAVAAALKVIWERSARPLRVAEILSAVPASRRTLERRFRDVLGRSVHDEIRRAHLERAKRLLVEGQDPLKAVASRSGFRDPQQFSRVFRASEGLTPKEFRQRHWSR